MTDTTKFDPAAVKKSADTIGKLLDDMGPFTKLANNWPEAGTIPLAVWLEAKVDDRRNAVIAHANHMKTSFAKMSEALTNVSNQFQNTDGQNGTDINTILGNNLQSDAETQWKSDDESLEKDQRNFSSDADKKPGDGYSKNLNDPV